MGFFKFFGIIIVWRVLVRFLDFYFNISIMLVNILREL